MSNNRPRALKRITESLTVRFGLLGVTLFIGLLFVIQINLTATKGYDIRDLEQQIVKLEKESKDLQLAAVELESMNRIVVQLPDYNLVEARPDAYLDTGVTAVAAR